MRSFLEGSALHGGHTRLEITESDSFKLYMHFNSKEPTHIMIKPNNARVEDHLVSIGNNGKWLRVVEHLFSALYGMDMWTLRVDVFGEELPIFDGSCKKYVDVLQYNVCKPLVRARLDKGVMVNENTSFIRYDPSNDDSLTIIMELVHPYIGRQHLEIDLNRKNYIREIAPARTFVYTDESDPRLKNLPPYGIGITEQNVYSSEPLRFIDEPVRHKVLDLLGDLFLLQRRLCGTIHAYNTFHMLNIHFVTKILANL